MVSKIDHIGIAVESIEESLKLYTDILGLTLEGTEVVEEQKVKTAFLPIGDTEIELLESTHPDGPIARFIQKGDREFNTSPFEWTILKKHWRR